jgi:PKHD-type hydroxylase
MTWGLHIKRVNDFAFYNEAFSDFEVDQIIRSTVKQEQVKAEVHSEKNSVLNESVRKTIVQWVPTVEQNSWLYRKITDLVNLSNSEWFNFNLLTIEELQFSIYNVDGFYGKHVDHFPSTPGNPRKLSFVVQLTDPEEYQGGSTLLYTSETPHAITKQKGSITFFPSYILHEVEPITAGTRIALVGWVSGPPFR